MSMSRGTRSRRCRGNWPSKMSWKSSRRGWADGFGTVKHSRFPVLPEGISLRQNTGLSACFETGCTYPTSRDVPFDSGAGEGFLARVSLNSLSRGDSGLRHLLAALRPDQPYRQAKCFWPNTPYPCVLDSPATGWRNVALPHLPAQLGQLARVHWPRVCPHGTDHPGIGVQVSPLAANDSVSAFVA